MHCVALTDKELLVLRFSLRKDPGSRLCYYPANINDLYVLCNESPL